MTRNSNEGESSHVPKRPRLKTGQGSYRAKEGKGVKGREKGSSEKSGNQKLVEKSPRLWKKFGRNE